MDGKWMKPLQKAITLLHIKTLGHSDCQSVIQYHLGNRDMSYEIQWMWTINLFRIICVTVL